MTVIIIVVILLLILSDRKKKGKLDFKRMFENMKREEVRLK